MAKSRTPPIGVVAVLFTAALAGPAVAVRARPEAGGYWSLSGGTSQPPGAWVQVTQVVSAARSLPLAETARLFALESMALADTVAPTYSTKYAYRFWRPTTAIRQADQTFNPETVADTTWTAMAASIGTPPDRNVPRALLGPQHVQRGRGLSAHRVLLP